MKNRFMLLLPILLCALAAGAANAEEISVATLEWRPYASEKLPDKGFTSEIVSQAFARVGLSAQFTFMPWKRARQMTETGRFAALSPAYFSGERKKVYEISEPYARSRLVLCALKGKEVPFEKLRDLEPYRIGVVMGYVYSPEFDGADFLKKDETSSDLLNLKKLFSGRVDLIAIDRFVAVDLLKNEPSLAQTPEDVVFLDKPLALQPIHLMIAKSVPGAAEKIAAFNRSLKEIIADGTVEKIIKKYGLSADKK